MYCSREYQPTSRFIQQYEKSTSNIMVNIDLRYEIMKYTKGKRKTKNKKGPKYNKYIQY